jgi:predicted phosphodiesterase
MRFYLASDIHNEFSVFNFPVLENESEMTLVLAGDIFVVKKPANGIAFLTNVSGRFKNVIVIAGNHEFYGGGSLVRTPVKIREIVAEFPNVHFLDNTSVVLDGIRFFGSVFWTDFHDSDPVVKLLAGGQMNDYNQIRTGTVSEPYMKKVSTNDIQLENLHARRVLLKELEEAKVAGQRCVVVTHHSPHVLSRSAEYQTGLLDYAYFNTGLEDLILDYSPPFWLHGHTHAKADYMIGDTRVVCNPRGYSNDPNGYQNSRLSFDTGLVFEL